MPAPLLEPVGGIGVNVFPSTPLRVSVVPSSAPKNLVVPLDQTMLLFTTLFPPRLWIFPYPLVGMVPLLALMLMGVVLARVMFPWNANCVDVLFMIRPE